jgi:hypothetical protein
MRKYIERLTLFVMAKPQYAAYLIVALAIGWACAGLSWLFLMATR